jgi:hypothetical protein
MHTCFASTRGGIRIFKALARLASNSKFLLAKSEKSRQNHVFAVHLYSVHFVVLLEKYTITNVCVCVILINKSPGKKDSLKGGKNTRQTGK